MGVDCGRVGVLIEVEGMELTEVAVALTGLYLLLMEALHCSLIVCCPLFESVY